MLNNVTIEINENQVEILNISEAQEEMDLKLENVNYINTFDNNYENLYNIPKINQVELKGNKTFEELGFEECLNQEIEDMFK